MKTKTKMIFLIKINNVEIEQIDLMVGFDKKSQII